MNARLSTVALGLMMTAVAAAPARAQMPVPPSDKELIELKEKATSEVWVYQDNDPDKEPVHGFLTKLTDHELTVLVNRQEETLPLDSIWRIERRGDTIWDGFAVGAAAGMVEWALLIAPEVRHGNPEARVMTAAISMGIWGIVGAGIDALAVGRTTVYDANRRARSRSGPALAMSPDGRSAMLSWTVKF